MRPLFRTRSLWLGLPVVAFLSWLWFESFHESFNVTWKGANGGFFSRSGRAGEFEAGYRSDPNWRVEMGLRWQSWKAQPEPAPWLPGPRRTSVKPLHQTSAAIPYWLLIACYLCVWLPVVVWRVRRLGQARTYSS